MLLSLWCRAWNSIHDSSINKCCIVVVSDLEIKFSISKFYVTVQANISCGW